MAKKYIINDLSGQSITGNVSITGEFENTYTSSVQLTYIDNTNGDFSSAVWVSYDPDDYWIEISNPTSETIGHINNFTNAPSNSEITVNNQYGGITYAGQNIIVGNVYKIKVQGAPPTGTYDVEEIKFLIGSNFYNNLRTREGNVNVDSGGTMNLFSNGNINLTSADSVSEITITTNDNDISHTWAFQPNGELRFPDDTAQSTAYIQSDIKTYKALLTQTGPITGYWIADFNQGLIIGETYEITNYISNDDFSNIANVIFGDINTTGCRFIATGEYPTNWLNGSELVSDGGLVVSVLENNLGFDVDWRMTPFGGSGYYLAGVTGPYLVIEAFPRNFTSVKINKTDNSPYLVLNSNVISLGSSWDSLIQIEAYELDVVGGNLVGNPVNDRLYYTPIEINIKMDLTTTRISGEIIPTGFPFNNASYDLLCNGSLVMTFYGSSTVNNFNELASALNYIAGSTEVGKFVEYNGSVIYVMTKYKKQQLCRDRSLTFRIFAD